MASAGQLSYIHDLGGDRLAFTAKSYDEASAEISRLKDIKYAGSKSYVSKDPRLEMVKGMMDLVPDGYYATQADGPGTHVDFVRVSRPTKGKYKGCVKIQTQHSEVWREAIIGWPSGAWSVYRSPAIEMLMLTIADHKTCAMRYSIEVQSCCICNKVLTDDRSRHYLIGPVCDKKPYGEKILEHVDDQNGGLTYEELVRHGMPTRVWQDKALVR